MRRNWYIDNDSDRENLEWSLAEDIPMSISRKYPQIINRPRPSLCGDKFDDTWAPAVTMERNVLNHDDYGTL